MTKRQLSDLERVAADVAVSRQRARAAGDPLNLTRHSKTTTRKPALACDPVEFVGQISRTRPALSRLSGRNKLNAQQAQAAETYRNAFETIMSPLGGTMNFDRPRNGRGATSRCPPEAALMASDVLKRAREHIGVRATAVVEQIVCVGRSVEQCTRLIYGYADDETMSHRDLKHVGRVLHDALTDLGELWHPPARRQGMRACRLEELIVGSEGSREIKSSSYVAG